MSEPERIVGLDVGDVRIGVAVSDPLGIMSLPHSVIRRETLEADIEAVRRVVKETGAIRIVAGLPITLKGERGPQAQKVTAFLDALGPALGIEIVTQDERFSTAAAERVLLGADMRRKKRKNVIDKVAAQHILETYLDRMAHTRASTSP